MLYYRSVDLIERVDLDTDARRQFDQAGSVNNILAGNVRCSYSSLHYVRRKEGAVTSTADVFFFFDQLKPYLEPHKIAHQN